MGQEKLNQKTAENAPSVQEAATTLIKRFLPPAENLAEEIKELEPEEIEPANWVNSFILYDSQDIYPYLLREIKTQIETGPLAKYFQVIYVNAQFVDIPGERTQGALKSILPEAILNSAGMKTKAPPPDPDGALNNWVEKVYSNQKCVLILIDNVEVLLDGQENEERQAQLVSCFKELPARPAFFVRTKRVPGDYGLGVIHKFNEFLIQDIEFLIHDITPKSRTLLEDPLTKT